MKVIDLNLLLYAHNSEIANHAAAREWWEQTLSEDEPVGLAWVVVLGFLRISTRPGVFPRPLSVDQALTVVQSWMDQPQVVLLHPGGLHWPILQDLLQAAGAAGNFTTDAHLAALALEYGGRLYSTDGDFRRFGPRLPFTNPIPAA